ncbi:MAG: lysylphosphatidylglycerol synthase transmembrane domain-containing protein [Bacteroidales bacterium]
MKKLVFSVLQYLIFLSIGLLLLWLVFRKIDLSLIVDELLQINYFWIILCFISGIISHISRAVRWNLLINSMNYKTSHLRTFYAVMVGYLANLAIPRIGEVTRCGIVAKTEKIPVNSLIGTVISERIFDMIVLIIMTFLVIVFQLKLVGSFVSKYLFLPLLSKFDGNKTSLFIFVAGALVVVALLILVFRKMRPVFRKYTLYQKFWNMLKGFWDGILTIKRMKQKGWFLFWTLMIWGNYFMMTYLCFFALKATSHLTVIDGLTVLALGSFGFVAPVPGGLGAYHFIVKAILFELYQIPPASAASYATIAHFAQTIILLAVGAFSYLMVVLYMKRKSHDQARKASA